jgi:hypothetical protein
VVAAAVLPVGIRVVAGVALRAGDGVAFTVGDGVPAVAGSGLGVGDGATGGTTPADRPGEAGLDSTPRGTLHGPVSTWAGARAEEAPDGECWLVLEALTELAGLTYW